MLERSALAGGHISIVAATHRDLEQRVKEGQFREDLFYRLDTFLLQVPPLREREDDWGLLAHRFIQQWNKDKKNQLRLSTQGSDLLGQYAFPSNVRELQNAMQRAATFATDSYILPEHLPDRIRRSGVPKALVKGSAS